jgi:phage-related protein
MTMTEETGIKIIHWRGDRRKDQLWDCCVDWRTTCRRDWSSIGTTEKQIEEEKVEK